MQQPCLRIFAGCNGSGKSTYSHVFSQDAFPFDFDKRFLERYKSMPDSELREEIAKNYISEELLTEFNKAILNKESFAFETNFSFLLGLLVLVLVKMLHFVYPILGLHLLS